MVENKAFMYRKVPEALPVAGEHLTVEDIGFDDSAPPPKNGFTTRNLYASYDPSQRGRMRVAGVKSYSAEMQTGEPVVSISVIGEVLKSDTSAVPVGATVQINAHAMETFSRVDENHVRDATVIQPREGIPLTAYLGVLGMTGMTAYGFLQELAQPKKGDVILISAAAGAVGQVAGQIALRKGLKVIGSVGDDRKLDFILNDLKFSAGFNYKKENMSDAIARLAPEGLDIYFDNVGGELLDVCFLHMKDHGRIVACGAMSAYNNDIYRLKNYAQVVRRRLRYQGAIVFDPDIAQWTKERDENVSRWLLDGSLKTAEHITEGMDNAVEGFLGMMTGQNLGKSILKI